MDTAPIIAKRKQQWTKFLDGTGRQRMLLVRYEPDNIFRPWPRPDNVPQRIEWAWDQYQRQLARCTWLDDDTVPRLYPCTGTEIFAEAFGCPVHLPDDDMPFAGAMIHSAAEVGKVREPSLDAPPLKRLFDIADELARRAGPGAVMQLIDVQSPMDIAALIWDKNDFFMALIESPDAVRELAGKTSRVLTTFLDAWFARYGHDFIAHYPDYYMPRGITLSEDEIGIVSCEMFEELFLPELISLSNRYGGIGMHCCADSKHQWANFLRIPNLRILNLVRPLNQVREAFGFFTGHTAQMHSVAWDEAQIRWLLDNAPHARVVIEANAKTPDEARQIVERFRNLESVR